MKTLSVSFSLILLFSTFTFGKDYKKNFNHTFSVKEGVTIVLENGDGDVQINTWEKDEIEVEVIYHASSKYAGEKDLNNFDVEFNQSGDEVYIIGHEYNHKTFNFISFHYLKYNYKISAPAYANIDIKSDDGNVEILNIMGDIDCKLDDGNLNIYDVKNYISRISAQDGNVNIEKHEGDLHINSDDGNVTIVNAVAKQMEISIKDGRLKVRNSSANYYVDSDDGNITLVNVSGNDLDARSKDGNIDIIFDGEGSVDLNVRTDDGSVDIELSNPVSAQFSFESGDGHIRFDGKDSYIIREDEHYIKGEFGDGAGKIKVRTNDGAISVSTNF